MDRNINNRIQSLLAKATDPAASEAEAESAMRMARKLQVKHGLSDEDLQRLRDAGEDTFTRADVMGRKTKFGTAIHPIDKYLAAAIGKFCGCVVWRTTEPSGLRGTSYFGMDADVEFAMYLRAAWIKHFDMSWAVYSEDKRRVRDRAALRQGFSAGFALEMRDRMEKWGRKSVTEDADGPTHNALVIKRTDMVSAELARRGIHLHYGAPSGKDYGRDPNAAGAGAQAARNAGFGRATAGATTRLLGN